MKKTAAILLTLCLVFALASCAAKSATASTSAASAAKSSAASASASSSTASASSASSSAAASAAAASSATSSASSSADGTFGNIKNGVPTDPTVAPKDLKVAVVMGNASMSGSSVPCAAIEEICKHFSWTIQTWDGEGDPSKENDAIMSAISWGAQCIITCSVQASNVQSSLQAADEAGIPCGSLSCGNDTPNKVTKAEGYNYKYDIGTDYHGLGYSLGQWIHANTSGSGKVACWDFAGEYSIDYTREGLYDAFKDLGIAYVDNGCFTFDQLGDVLNRTVSTYLANNPDTEFIYFPFDPAAQPVAEFLDLNGYTDVKVIGVLGNSEMVSLIKQGSTAAATAAYDNSYLGYAAMDQMLRVLNGDSLIDPHGENCPYLVLDKTNAPDGDSGWTAPFDYASSYYAVWVQK